MVKVIDEQIAKLINKLFGGMIEEISAQSINISAVHGTARLQNLTVRPQWLAGLGLPVLLNAGTVGSLDIDIPLSHLRSKPIRICIKDVLVSVSPNPSVNVKKAQLDKDLIEHKVREDERKAGELDPESKLGKLLSKIAQNIHIVVENVHIRFEDTLSRQRSWDCESDRARCFSLGVTLDRLEMAGCVLSPDGEWQPRCVKAALRFLNKSFAVGSVTKRRREDRGSRVLDLIHPAGLGLYLQHGERPLLNTELSAWAAEMRGFIASADYETGTHWLFGPVSAEARVSIDTQAAFTPCSSRIWRDALPKSASRFVEEEMAGSRAAGIEVAVPIDMAQMRTTVGGGHIMHLHWAFESEKDGVGFEVLYRATDDSSTAWVHLQACARAESSRARVFGSCVVPRSGGILLLRWNNAPTKTKASRIRYVLWLRRTSKAGRNSRPKDLECAVLADDDLAALLERDPQPPQPKLQAFKVREDELVTDASLGSQTELEVVTGEVALNLHHRSLQDLSAMQNWYASVHRWQKFEHLRPMQPSVESFGGRIAGRAREWWQFAITCTIESLPGTIFRKNLRPIVDGALEYAALFKRKYSAGRPWLAPLSDADMARLEVLEEYLPLDMIRSRRKVTWSELAQDEQMKYNQLRDARETEARLLSGPPAETVTKGVEGNAVLASGWLHYDKAGNSGKLKRRYLTLTAVVDDATLYSGWLTILPPSTSTASNGAVQRRRSVVLQQWWFRLRKGCLRWFADEQERGGCRGVLDLLPSAQVRQRPGSADCWEIVTEDAKTGLLFRCERGKDVKAWVAATLTATGNSSLMVPIVRRWLLVAKAEGGTPSEAIQLQKQYYTLSQPDKARPKFEAEHQRLLSVTSAVGTGKVRHYGLAAATAEVESTFQPFLALLEPEAGALLDMTEGEGLARLESRGQSAADIGGEDDDEPAECGTVAAERNGLVGATSTYILRRVVVLVSKIRVQFGITDDPWVAISADALKLDTSATKSGALDLEATIQDVEMEDLYSRDSCYPQLLQRMVPFKPTPWARSGHSDADGDDEERPIFRFRYKKTFRSDMEDTTTTVTTATSVPESVPPSPFMLGLQLELELAEESDVWINLVVQPLRFVVNPALITIMQSFEQLSKDESLEALGSDIVKGLRRIEFSQVESMSRSSDMDSPIADPDGLSKVKEEEVGIEHRRILIQFRAMEMMVADNLSNFREDAVAVRLQLDSFHLANSDFPAPSSCTPRSADSSGSRSRVFRSDSVDSGDSNSVDSPKWASNNLYYTPRSPRVGYGFDESESPFAGSDSWDSDTAIVMGGQIVNLRAVCSTRDDEWTNRSVLLKPATIDTNLRISTVPPSHTRGEWVNLDVDTRGLDMQLSRESFSVLLRVVTAAVKDMKMSVRGQALFGSPSSSQARANGTNGQVSPRYYTASASPPQSPMGPRPIGAIKENQNRRVTSNPRHTSSPGSHSHQQRGGDHSTGAGIARNSSGAGMEPNDPRLLPLGRAPEPVILRAVVRIRKTRLTVDLGHSGDADGATSENHSSEGADHGGVGVDVLALEVNGAELGMMLTSRSFQTVLHAHSMAYTIATQRAGQEQSPLQTPANGPTILGHAIPIGLSTISTLVGKDLRSAVSVTRRWLYNIAEPERLIPFRNVGDLLQVMRPSEIKAVLPLLMLGMRVATLNEGVSALRGGDHGSGGDGRSDGGNRGQLWHGIEQLEAVAAQASNTVAAVSNAAQRSPGGSILSAAIAGAGTVAGGADSGRASSELSRAMLQFVRNLVGVRVWEQIVPALNAALDFAGGAAEKVDSARAQAQALGITPRNDTVDGKNDSSHAQVGPQPVPEEPSSLYRPLPVLEVLSATALQGRIESLSTQFSGSQGGGRPEPEPFSLVAEEPAAEEDSEQADHVSSWEGGGTPPDFSALPLAELQLLCAALDAQPKRVARSPIRGELEYASKAELNDALLGVLSQRSYIWLHIQKRTAAVADAGEGGGAPSRTDSAF